MKRILIIYGTTEGQTKKIAMAIADSLGRLGFKVDLLDSHTSAKKIEIQYDAVIAGASIHLSKFPARFEKLIASNAEQIRLVPFAFFSVCLGILQADDAATQTKERKFVSDFLTRVQLDPMACTIFPGALLFSKYGWVKTQIMKRIARKAGLQNNAETDQEFTDWIAVKKFALDFIQSARLDTATTRPELAPSASKP